MNWYVFIVVLLMYPIVLSQIGKRKEINLDKLIVFNAASLLLFFMACRSANVGADTSNYIFIFKQISLLDYKEFLFSNLFIPGWREPIHIELGYRLYNKCLSLLSTNSQVITAFNSFIIMYLVTRLSLESSNPALMFWLYVTLGIFQTQMNMSRNAIAILICYDAFKYIKERNLIRFALLTILASLFHASAFVIMPMYWLYRVHVDKHLVMKLLSLTIVFGLSFEILKTLLKKYVPAFWLHYLYAQGVKTESILPGLFHFFLVLLIYVFFSKEEREGFWSDFNISLWMILLNVFFLSFAVSISVAGRVGALFGPYLMISIPEILEKNVKSEKRKQRIQIYVYLISGIQYILRLSINNIGGTMPYSFFWQN